MKWPALTLEQRAGYWISVHSDSAHTQCLVVAATNQRFFSRFALIPLSILSHYPFGPTSWTASRRALLDELLSWKEACKEGFSRSNKIQKLGCGFRADFALTSHWLRIDFALTSSSSALSTTGQFEEQFEQPSIRVRSIDLGCCCISFGCFSLCGLHSTVLVYSNWIKFCFAHHQHTHIALSAEVGRLWSAERLASNLIFCICSDHVKTFVCCSLAIQSFFDRQLAQWKCLLITGGARPSAQ